MTNEDTIVVFTARSPERIIREGGSQAWILNPIRARWCKWLICTQNQHNLNHEFSDATEPHGCAFLLGKISGVHTSPEEGSKGRRWIVRISEFARINRPNFWLGRNPVRYSSLEELGISLDGIEFQPMPLANEPQPRPVQHTELKAKLTIEEAKKALAETFGVKAEAIEIVIRG
jgi:hypothetical protein